jgi:hypothetical protein
VILHFALGVDRYAIEHLDHRSDLHDEACFFEHFARAGLFEGLTRLDNTAWKVPLPRERLVRALHQDNAPVDEDDRADAKDGAVGIAASNRHWALGFGL